MINELKKAFPQIDSNTCLEIVTEKEFEVYDCPEEDKSCTKGRCYIRIGGQFKVFNRKEKGIGFLAVDKCIFFDDDKFKKCDCIVFDEKTFCFIEIKEFNSNKKVGKKRRTKRVESLNQVKSTIEKFRDKFKTDKTLEAYICIKKSTEGIPATQASSSDRKLEFEEELRTKLFDGCQKEFT
jgi:hypothetical protein